MRGLQTLGLGSDNWTVSEATMFKISAVKPLEVSEPDSAAVKIPVSELSIL